MATHLSTAGHMIPWAHPGPQPKRQIGSDVFAQMTAECLIVYNGAPLSPFAPAHGGSGTRSNRLMHGSLGPSEFSAETASRLVQPFLQGSLV